MDNEDNLLVFGIIRNHLLTMDNFIHESQLMKSQFELGTLPFVSLLSFIQTSFDTKMKYLDRFNAHLYNYDVIQRRIDFIKSLRLVCNVTPINKIIL